MKKPIQDNIADLERLVQLVTETEISEVDHETQSKIDSFLAKEEKRVQALEQEINELQERWDNGNKKESTLRQSYENITQRMEIRQQEEKDDDDNYKKESIRSGQLKKQLQILTAELNEEAESASHIMGDTQEMIELALYRGMGVRMFVEEDMSVHKATLTCENTDDVTLLPITKQSSVTTKRIWDFISQGL
ncbi:hypothetical protein INT47_006195 [Mucor saturninus]|uniref:Kinetochore protein Spc24 n=1 Tax=Mucor saturninus TaxID=64648 RepID=A0A8H7RCB6_9FUNG|nr:hypothetical protein INT47_006195 [Mucor saturninus]